MSEFEQKVKDDECMNNVDIKEEKIKQLKTLKCSISCGPDECHPYFLQECTDEIYLQLTDIFRKTLAPGEVPEDWRRANITCIFRKGNKQDPGIYRPVSLTSVKVLMDHLSDIQFGFRKK